MTVDNQHYKDWPNEAAFNASATLADVRTPITLPITGSFPEYAAGVLYRTGPGFFRMPSKAARDGLFSIRHWFDGFTTTHRFELVSHGSEQGCSEILYSSKMQTEELVQAAEQTGRVGSHVNFAERDPCDTLYRKIKSSFAPSTPQKSLHANIGVALRWPVSSEATAAAAARKHGTRASGDVLTITTDNPSVKHMDASTLEPLEVSTQALLHPDLTGQMSAAHASEDPVTGDIFNYNLTLGPSHVYRVFRASPTGSVDILAEIRGSSVRGAYLHSLFLTENFVVLCVWPAYFTYMGLSILWNRNLLDSIKFDANASTSWYVIDRRFGQGLVHTFTSPGFFCFHTVNAWEESNNDTGMVALNCELVEFADAQILNRLEYQYIVSSDAMRSRTEEDVSPAANITRYCLGNICLPNGKQRSKMATGNAIKIMSIAAGDLPRINPNYVLKRHRYVYTILDRGKSSFVDGIGKIDTITGTTTVWEEARHTPGEAIFVPRPEAKDEDDGVVLSVVFDGDLQTSFLLCLDARNMVEIARATAPGPIGIGFHGLHVPCRALVES